MADTPLQKRPILVCPQGYPHHEEVQRHLFRILGGLGLDPRVAMIFRPEDFPECNSEQASEAFARKLSKQLANIRVPILFIFLWNPGKTDDPFLLIRRLNRIAPRTVQMSEQSRHLLVIEDAQSVSGEFLIGERCTRYELVESHTVQKLSGRYFLIIGSGRTLAYDAKPFVKPYVGCADIFTLEELVARRLQAFLEGAVPYKLYAIDDPDAPPLRSPDDFVCVMPKDGLPRFASESFTDEIEVPAPDTWQDETRVASEPPLIRSRGAYSLQEGAMESFFPESLRPASSIPPQKSQERLARRPAVMGAVIPPPMPKSVPPPPPERKSRTGR